MMPSVSTRWCDLAGTAALLGVYLSISAQFLSDLPAELGLIRDGRMMFFQSRVIAPLHNRLIHLAQQITLSPGSSDAVPLSRAQAHRIFVALRQLFVLNLTVFQRKLCPNLSHERTKAMNLNSCVNALFDPALVTASCSSCSQKSPSSVCPEHEFLMRFSQTPDYFLVLDADSFLHPDYLSLALRRFHSSLDASEDLALVQCHFSGITEHGSQLSKYAGLSTDALRNSYFYLSKCKSGFWSGTNGLFHVGRLLACARRHVASNPSQNLPRWLEFFCSKTPIEDTGTTMKLALHGLRSECLARQLSWSESPSSFASLIIQRRRWANGGLILWLDLLKAQLFGKQSRLSAEEFILRSIWLLGPSLEIAGFFAFTLHPFDPVYVALPIFLTCTALTMTDLRISLADTLLLHTLGAFLIPVHGSGVVRSVIQLITGTKQTFEVTPKDNGNPRLQWTDAVLQLVLISLILFASPLNWMTLSIAIMWVVGLHRFIGIRRLASSLLTFFER